MAYWSLELWENVNGVCYVANDLLDDLKSKDKLLFERLSKKIETLTRYSIPELRSAGYLEKIDKDLWELRFILPKAQVRFLGCLVYIVGSSKFYALCAFRKKTQKISNKHIKLAKERQKEFEKQR